MNRLYGAHCTWITKSHYFNNSIPNFGFRFYNVSNNVSKNGISYPYNFPRNVQRLSE
jgi:hypothetical protein